MTRPALLTLVLAAAAACGPVSTERDPLAARADAIVGGVVAEGDPAVVALTAYGSQYCSGTLIAPRTVLTAAHCIQANARPSVYQVRFGTRASAPFLSIAMEAQFAHPAYSSERLTSDIGLIRLSAPAVGIKPILPNDTPLTGSDVGRDIRHVGFGATSGGGGGNGTKREALYPVREVTATLIESAGAGRQQTCSGDSGGPGLMILGEVTDERVAGVVSYGDRDCLVFGADTRVDAFLPWLKGTYEQWDPPSCELDARCLDDCATPDPDCACQGDAFCNPECLDAAWDPDCPKTCGSDGTCSSGSCPQPDPDCVAPGEACTSADVCEAGLCLDRPEGTYCSRPCDMGCTEGMACGGDGICYLETDALRLEQAVATYRTSGCGAIGGVGTGSFGLSLALLAFARLLRSRRH